MKIEIELPEIPGYEYTGEYRSPKIGELFWSIQKVVECSIGLTSEYPILRVKEKSRILIYQWMINCSANTNGDTWDRGYRVINGTEEYITGLCSEFGYTYRKMSGTPLWSLDGDTL